MKRIAMGFIAASLLASPLYAQVPNLEDMSPKQRYEAIKNMPEAQREEFMKARKEKWEAMSDGEKVKLLEQRRKEFRQERDAEWNAMSDKEKIAHAEEKFKKMRHHKKGGKGGKNCDDKRGGHKKSDKAPTAE